MSAASLEELSALDADLTRLVREAQHASARAYAPYSNFRVGAALRAPSGAVVLGCNVENASYGATLCAERGAVMALVASGERSFDACAIWVDAATPAAPCGMCRQVLWELGPGALVVSACPSGVLRCTLAELLPHAFELAR